MGINTRRFHCSVANVSLCKLHLLRLRTVPTNSKVFLEGLLNMREKPDLNKCY